VGGGQIIRGVVGQLGQARLGGLEMQDGIREALLFERNYAQGEVRECTARILAAGRELLERPGARGCGRFAIGAAERLGGLG
jgi:hypothetical protein